MSDHHDQIQRLLSEAADQPRGPLQVEMMAEAARIADLHQDVAEGFRVRRLLMDAALGGGQPQQMTVAFTWCVGQSERNPQLVPPEQILWQYRWVISNLPQFPEVPRQQLIEAISDMTVRYRAAGSTLRPVHLLALNTGIKLRDPNMATAAHDAWAVAERDALSDDARTERSFVVDLLVFLKQYQDAVDQCPQVLAGRADDMHFFGTDSAQLLIPLLELGRVADAIRVQRSGYRYVARRHRYLDMVGAHMEFLARLDQFATPVKMFEEHLGFALDTKQLMDRFDFSWSALILFERMRRTGSTTVKLRLPKEFPLAGSGRSIDVSLLCDWLRADALDLANRFDSRNGNTYFQDKFDTTERIVSSPKPEAAP